MVRMRFAKNASFLFLQHTDKISVVIRSKTMEETLITYKTYISSEARFYTVKDLQKMLGWSLNTVLRLFNDPHFPASDFGKTKVVEAHALINYFSKRHERETEKYWTEGGKTC